MSIQASASQIIIFNKTSSTISVRVTDTEDEGTPRFIDIGVGEHSIWTRGKWQVAFVLKNALNPSDDEAKTLVVKPGQSYNINP
jgi:hypothetical protein